MTDRDRLIEARTLIKVKRYAEARAILKAMPGNATARAWLAKLDATAPKKRRRSLAFPLIALLLVLGGLTATAALIQRGNDREVILPTEARLPVVLAPTRTWTPVPTATATPLPSATVVPSATVIPSATNTLVPPTETWTPDPSVVQGDNGLLLTLEEIEVYGRIDNYTPQNGVFLTVLGNLYNPGTINNCTTESDFSLRFASTTYSLAEEVIPEIWEQFQSHRYYPDMFNLCVKPGDRMSMFFAFDMPPDNGSSVVLTFSNTSLPFPYSWLVKGGEIVAYMTAFPPTSTPRPTRTSIPAPAPTRSPEDQGRQIVLNTPGVRIGYNDIRTLVVNERTVTLMYYVQDSYGGPDFLKDQFADDSLYLICAFRNAGYWSQNFAFAGRADFVDSYGNSSENKAIQIEVSAATARQINCNNLGSIDLFNIAETVWMHPAIR